MRIWVALLAFVLALGVALGGGSAAEAGGGRRAGKRVVVDVGGEGRYKGAINLNPSRVTSTTGTPGRPIPRHVQGVGEKMPFPARSAHELIVENAPIRPGTARELARVIKPGGTIRLSHPSEYATSAHAEVAKEVGGRFFQRDHGGITTTVIRAPVKKSPAKKPRAKR